MPKSTKRPVKTDTPKLVKHTPNDASGRGNSPGQPKLIKHSPKSVSGANRKMQHPMDQKGRG